jgi:hypothetical protein
MRFFILFTSVQNSALLFWKLSVFEFLLGMSEILLSSVSVQEAKDLLLSWIYLSCHVGSFTYL